MDNRLQDLWKTKSKLEEKIANAPNSKKLFKEGKITEEQYLHNENVLNNLKNKLERVNNEISIARDMSAVNMKMNSKKFRDDKYRQAEMEGLGMEWYKFNIYFRIFTPIVYMWENILDALDYKKGNGDLGLIIIIDIAIIVWIIFTRHWLYKFKYKGIINYFAVGYGTPVLFSLFSLLTSGNTTYFNESSSMLLGSVIILIPELIYWRKRAHLFEKNNSIF